MIAFTRYTRFVFVSGEMFCSSAHLFILVKGIIFFAIFALQFRFSSQFSLSRCNPFFRDSKRSHNFLLTIIFDPCIFLAFFLCRVPDPHWACVVVVIFTCAILSMLSYLISHYPFANFGLQFYICLVIIALQ